MSIVQLQNMNPDEGRIAVLNEGTGSKIIASNQCGDFAFKLFKSTDPRVDIESIADYDKNVMAYVGARNWNKFKYEKDYTNASQLKFSNIKTPGPGYLVDMRWWLDYTITITFKDFPYPNGTDGTKEKNVDPLNIEKIFNDGNVMCMRPFPLHQCTDNIHLRLNNRDLISYPTQTLNQRMEYWRQDKLKESCGFCPHRKPNVQTTYELGDRNTGRSPFMNIGATYDGDYGNETVITPMDGYTISEWEGTTDTVSVTEQVGGQPAKKEYYLPWSKINGTITMKMREPVMAEPLDYYSQRGGSKTMNNITSIDLEYNFNNLRNMLLFNRATLFKKAKGAPKAKTDGIEPDKAADWWSTLIENNLEKYISIEVTAAFLELNIATPHVTPSMPFVTDYVEYRRFEKVDSINGTSGVIDPKSIRDDRNLTYEIESDIYSLSYMPNSIYIWVAPNNANIYGSSNRVFYNNSYAQITHVEIDYGNLQKLCNHYDEKDLFLMALRNGLEDRQFIDWTRTQRVFYWDPYLIKDLDAEELMDKAVPQEFFGVGSVLRMIPGIDICSGGEQTLIGGMKITNETIKIRVKYRPLDIFNENQYSLYVAFEYNGICTVTPNFCDLAMIHIDSFNQIANAQRAPTYKISRIYGKGFWDKVKKGISKANEIAKKTGIVSKIASQIPHPMAQKVGALAAQAGYGYGTTRMRGGMVIPPGSFYRRY